MDGERSAKAPLCCSYRLVLSVLSCLGFMLLFALRFNVTAIMKCMVNQTAVRELSHTEESHTEHHIHETETHITAHDICHLSHEHKAEIGHANELYVDQDGEFIWPARVQNIIQMSFFCGTLITQIPGGLLSQRLGGKQFFGWSILVCGVITILTPVAARTGYILVIFLRFALGMSQGVIWPAMMAMWSRWAPPLERHRLTSCCFGGAALGVVAVYPMSNFLCQKSLGGWESLFFISGSVSIIWCIVWSLFAYDSPDEHPHISVAEMNYIESAIRSFTPVYVQATSISGLPYIGLFAVSLVSGIVYDFVLSKEVCSTTFARKTAVCIAMLLPAFLITWCGFLDCDKRLVSTSLLMVAIACSGLQFGCGYLNNFSDIAPAHTAVMYGISGTFSTISGVIALPLINLFAYGHGHSHWEVLFFLIAAIGVVGCIIFITYGSADMEAWAHVPTEETTPTDISSETDLCMRAARLVIKRSLVKSVILANRQSMHVQDV